MVLKDRQQFRAGNIDRIDWLHLLFKGRMFELADGTRQSLEIPWYSRHIAQASLLGLAHVKPIYPWKIRSYIRFEPLILANI
jgi:hypothetical protein